MKPSQIAASLPKIWAAGRVPFIWGDVGIGKSDVVNQISENIGDIVDIRLSLYDPTDLRGFPVKYLGKNGQEAMRFISPDILPRSGKGVIFLDEFPAAPPAVQAVAYQLILNRRLGAYEIPEGWRVVAAGNHARNGGVHYAPAPALANRFIHLEMECDATEWDVWAGQRNLPFLLRAFLRFRPALLHNVEARKQGHGFPTPRAWASVAALSDQNFSTANWFAVAKGTVGEAAAIEFVAFVKTAEELPSIEEILDDPETAKLPKSPGAKHAVSLMLEEYADKKNFASCLKYLGRLEVEYQTAFNHSVARNKVELCSTPAFIKWAMDNKVMLGMA